jgi:hypothetical protein
VRVRGEGDLEAACMCRSGVGGRKARWINGERAAVAEVDEVRRVAEPFVDEAEDIDHPAILASTHAIVK